jgi:hypothetical protein
MSKKFLLVFLIVIALIVAGYIFRNQSKITSIQTSDESQVRSVVESFGQKLKDVSLLSPSAPQELETNYKKFITPELLIKWQRDPSKAIGRLTSSPWPEKIEIVSIKRFDNKVYEVSGYIIEAASANNGITATKQPIELSVVKFDNGFLINSTASDISK